MEPQRKHTATSQKGNNVYHLLCSLNALPRAEYTPLEMTRRLVEVAQQSERPQAVSTADVKCTDLIRKGAFGECYFGGDFVYNIRRSDGTYPATITTTRGRMINPILLPLMERDFPYAALPVGDYIMDLAIVDPHLRQEMMAAKPECFGIRRSTIQQANSSSAVFPWLACY